MSEPYQPIDVANAPSAQTAALRIGRAMEIAVDVEADSMHAFEARLCFVQVATSDGIWLFDTLASGVTADVLAETFGDEGKTKYFHAAGGDLQYLAEAGVRVKGLFDTHRAATLLGWPKVGLADLVLQHQNVALDKAHQQSDFSIRPLPEDMRRYIADDVRYLCDVGRWVKEECVKADILEEVVLDCQRLCDEASVRPDLSTQFPKIPKGSLNPKLYQMAKAIGRHLHLCRLEWAKKANIPMGRMLSNAAIVSIATQPPSSIKELTKAQGVRGSFVREYGENVLELIRNIIEQSRQGLLPGEEENGNNKDSRSRKREDALREFRTMKATERKVTPSVVLGNSLIAQLSSAPPESLDDLRALPYFGDKRVSLYGTDILHLLRSMG